MEKKDRKKESSGGRPIVFQAEMIPWINTLPDSGSVRVDQDFVDLGLVSTKDRGRGNLMNTFSTILLV